MVSLGFPGHDKDLIAVYNLILKDTPWAKFDEQSDEIIRAFIGIKDEIAVRLDQNIDFDVLSPIFKLIPKLLLCRSQPNSKIDDNVTLRSKEMELFNEFKRYVQSLTELSPDPIADSVKFSQRINVWFTNSNILTMVACWLSVLAIIPPILYSLYASIIPVDGPITSPVVGAFVGVALTAAVSLGLYFHKRNNHD